MGWFVRGHFPKKRKYVLKIPISIFNLRQAILSKALLRVQFLPALGGRGWERGKAKASSSALLSKKGVGREGSIESRGATFWAFFKNHDATLLNASILHQLTLKRPSDPKKN